MKTKVVEFGINGGVIEVYIEVKVNIEIIIPLATDTQRLPEIFQLEWVFSEEMFHNFLMEVGILLLPFNYQKMNRKELSLIFNPFGYRREKVK